MDYQQDLPVCTACGTLYESQREDKHCPVCDDPRQFIPSPGQSWTTLRSLRHNHKNILTVDAVDPRIISIATEPKFGIGQRAILLKTPQGNVLWDCIAFLEDETVSYIKSAGGLAGIVISHPHFYTTNAVWARTFDCSVYVAEEDAGWLFSKPPESHLKLLTEVNTTIIPGVTAIKCGGHFPGSLCLHWEKNLFSSDTIMTVQSGRNPEEHYTPGKTATYSFMWAIPNMIPLDPRTIAQILERLEPWGFEASFGNIPGLDLRAKGLKGRLLESAKIQVRAMGWEGKEEGEVVLRQNWD